MCAGHFIAARKQPVLYRVHDVPSEEKVAALRAFLAELGLVLPGGEIPKPKDYAQLIEARAGLGERYSIWTANSRIDLMRNPKGAALGIFMRGENKDGLPPDPESAAVRPSAARLNNG